MRGRVALALALGALGAAPAGAQAAPEWIAATNFPVPASDLFESTPSAQLQIAYQSGGIATESFLQVQSLSPLQTTLHIGVMAPGGTYADRLTIASAPGAIPGGAQIAVAPDGAAVAAWSQYTGTSAESPSRYLAAYRPAGSAVWQAPAVIAEDSEFNNLINSNIEVAINAAGTAAVAVQHVAGGEKGSSHHLPVGRIDVAERPAGAGWQAAQRISPSNVNAEDMTLGIDGSGDLTVAYGLLILEGSSSSEDRYQAVVRRLPSASGIWGPQEEITSTETTHSIYAPHLAEDESGDAVLTYQFGPVAGHYNVWAVTRQGAQGPWSTPAQIVSSENSSAPEAAAMAPDGTAYVLYSYSGTNSGEDCAGVVRAPKGEAFSAHRCLSPTNQETSAGSIAFIGNDAFFAWRANPPGESAPVSVQGARWAASSALPDVARNLDPPSSTYGDPTLQPDEQGSVVAFFTDAHQGQLRAAAYDAGAPILLAESVPAQALIGQPVATSATFFDLWSGLAGAQPVWDFGDGSSAVSGQSATHTYSQAGTYTVTVSAADAPGNATSDHYTITITPTPAPPVAQRPSLTLQSPKCRRGQSHRACRRFRSSVKAWRRLIGHVSEGGSASNIAAVEVVVFRRHGRHYESLRRGHFHPATRRAASHAFLPARLRGEIWTLQLPRLRPGSYTIIAVAIDRAGARSTRLERKLHLH